MTKVEASRAATLVAVAAPYQLSAEVLRFYAARPLEQGISAILLAKRAVDAAFGRKAA